MICLPLYGDSLYILHDNDLPFNSDDHYTSGVQFGWISEGYSGELNDSFTQNYIQSLSSIVELVGVSFSERKRAGSISVQGMMITPNNLERTDAIYDDVPYMGTLSSAFSLLSWDSDDFDEYRFTIGVAGPNSGAEQLQKTVHKITGSIDPKGWDNQIGTRIIMQLEYVHGIKQYTGNFGDSKRFEWFNSYYADVGSFYCGAGVGSSVRYGENMPLNFKSSSGLLSGSKSDMVELEHKNSSFGWDVHGGVHLNFVGYLYLYEESKRLGYSFDRPNILPVLNAGATIYLKNFTASLDFFPSRSTVANPTSTSFARINLSWQFN